jgi:hypothetical protein
MIGALDILLAAFIAFCAILWVYRAYQAYRARKSAWKIVGSICAAAFLVFVASGQFWLEEPVVRYIASHF